AERAHAAPARDHALRGRAARGRCGRLHPAAALQRALYARSRTIAMNEKLLELARAYGIILDYYDIWGQQHHAAEHVLRTILQARGVAAADAGAVEASAARMLRERWAQVLPPAIVVRGRDAPWPIRISLPAASLDASLAWSVREEDGERHEGVLQPGTLPV